MPTRLATAFKPLYFLAALGAGGLAVSFFMYLMFLVPHPDTPIPTFDHLASTFASGSGLVRTLLVLDIIAIAVFAVFHLILLVTVVRAYLAFKRTDAYPALLKSNGEVGLLAMPLTYAMTMNVLFILAALSIPGLWKSIEYIFPFALVGFTVIGVYAFQLMGRYLNRVLSHEGFDLEDTNHFAQIMPAFAFTMLAVGFASPAAMSSTKVTSVLGMVGSGIFLAAAAAWIFVKLPVSFGAMLRKGLALEASPSLWMGIPIFTLIGITGIRVVSGFHHNVLHTKVPDAIWFGFFGLLVAAQLVMGLFGWSMMRHNGYFKTFVSGDQPSAPAYGLICPGVALAVLSMFFIHKGLVANHIVDRFSVTHFVLLAVVLGLQAITIRTYWQLNSKLLGEPKTADADQQLAGAAA